MQANVTSKPLTLSTSLSHHLWRLCLFDPGHLVPLLQQGIGIATVRYFREPRVGVFSLFDRETKVTACYSGVPSISKLFLSQRLELKYND